MIDYDAVKQCCNSLHKCSTVLTVLCTMHAGKHGNFGKVHITGEEVASSKFEISMQLAANNLDKKDFFGKVCLCKLCNLSCTALSSCVELQMCFHFGFSSFHTIRHG